MIFFYQLKKRLREGIPTLTGGLREDLQVRQCDSVAGSLGAVPWGHPRKEIGQNPDHPLGTRQRNLDVSRGPWGPAQSFVERGEGGRALEGPRGAGGLWGIWRLSVGALHSYWSKHAEWTRSSDPLWLCFLDSGSFFSLSLNHPGGAPQWTLTQSGVTPRSVGNSAALSYGEETRPSVVDPSKACAPHFSTHTFHSLQLTRCPSCMFPPLCARAKCKLRLKINLSELPALKVMRTMYPLGKTNKQNKVFSRIVRVDLLIWKHFVYIFNHVVMAVNL